MLPSRSVGGRAQRPDSPAVDQFALLAADVFELAGLLRRSGEKIARRHGQTQARWQLLSVISEGTWTVPTAASRLGITRQAVQRVADDLVADGSARYVENPAHRRSPLLEITTPGRRTLTSITNDSQRTHQPLLADISHDELSQVRQILAEITERLDEHPPDTNRSA